MWGKSRERSQATEQLKALNKQIQLKNKRRGRKDATGCVNVDLFAKIGFRLEDASLVYYESKDPQPFLIIQQDLNKAIKAHNWPDTWEVGWDQFLDDFHDKTGEDPREDRHPEDKGKTPASAHFNHLPHDEIAVLDDDP